MAPILIIALVVFVVFAIAYIVLYNSNIKVIWPSTVCAIAAGLGFVTFIMLLGATP